MPRKGITQVIVNLTSDEMRATWEAVKSHYGDEYSNSHVLYDLIRVRRNEIREKLTNRDRFANIDKRLANLEELVQEVLKELRNVQ